MKLALSTANITSLKCTCTLPFFFSGKDIALMFSWHICLGRDKGQHGRWMSSGDHRQLASSDTDFYRTSIHCAFVHLLT